MLSDIVEVVSYFMLEFGFWIIVGLFGFFVVYFLVFILFYERKETKVIHQDKEKTIYDLYGFNKDTFDIENLGLKGREDRTVSYIDYFANKSFQEIIEGLTFAGTVKNEREIPAKPGGMIWIENIENGSDIYCDFEAGKYWIKGE